MVEYGVHTNQNSVLNRHSLTPKFLYNTQVFYCQLASITCRKKALQGGVSKQQCAKGSIVKVSTTKHRSRWICKGVKSFAAERKKIETKRVSVLRTSLNFTLQMEVQQGAVSTPQLNIELEPFSRGSLNEDLKEQDRKKDADPSLRVSSLSKFVIPKKPKDLSDQEIRAQPKTNKKKPLKCPNCSLSFTLSSNLRRHMRLHLASKNIYRCDECGHTFAGEDRLARHVKTHSGERPFVCQECQMAFKTSGALRVHLMTHTGEKPFSCTECSTRFRHEFSLRVHLMIHTGERPFLCALCDKGFYKKRHLEFHMISHTNVKPAVCEECGARFRDNSRLKVHMRRHTGVKAFTCHVCKRKFEIEANCQKHLLTHKKERRAVRI